METSQKNKPIIGIHLDFKGVMFRPDYIPQLLTDLAGQGINTVLVEYEDIFPFDGWDIAADSSVSWSESTLQDFLKAADKNGIEVIPLQQCLGHLEYVYRWECYRSFALDHSYPSTVDFENAEARKQIFDMLRQVIEAHPNSRYVHLGMDEAHALVDEARKREENVVDLFIGYLNNLCDICEDYGKRPIVWSDMLEDHFKSGVWDGMRKKVTLMPWDYESTGETIKVGRICGRRFARHWLEEPSNPQAPPINSNFSFIEDMPKGALRALGKNLEDGKFTSMFQADMWKKLGFEVIGASGVRCSSHGGVMPFYIKAVENIRAWSRAVARAGIAGQVGTAWARGTTWCPPNLSFDLIWPLVGELARSMGSHPEPFWKALPEKTVERIIGTIGRCRLDWNIEDKVIQEMETLLPQVQSHAFEWQSIILMLKVLKLHSELDNAIKEVEYFHANNRPVDSEWQRRIDDQKRLIGEIAGKRQTVRKHFGKRYHGSAFEEWIGDMFDLYEEKIKDCTATCKRKKERAKKIYGG